MTEQATRSLPLEKRQASGRHCRCSKDTKGPKTEFTCTRRKSAEELQKEKSIIILLADSGKATVIMETDEYQEKMTKLISDRATYEKLKKDRPERIRQN